MKYDTTGITTITKGGEEILRLDYAERNSTTDWATIEVNKRDFDMWAYNNGKYDYIYFTTHNGEITEHEGKFSDFDEYFENTELEQVECDLIEYYESDEKRSATEEIINDWNPNQF